MLRKTKVLHYFNSAIKKTDKLKLKSRVPDIVHMQYVYYLVLVLFCFVFVEGISTANRLAINLMFADLTKCYSAGLMSSDSSPKNFKMTPHFQQNYCIFVNRLRAF